MKPSLGAAGGKPGAMDELVGAAGGRLRAMDEHIDTAEEAGQCR